MRFIIMSYCILGFFAIGSIYIITHSQNHEVSILGKWKEVAWEYEKVDAGNSAFMNINNNQKAEAWKNITLHQAEVWEFMPDKTVKLFSNNQLIENMRWNIKGRGNILELNHYNNRKESYQIQEINDDLLIIHFNLDLQVRGIVKMTFKRIKS